MENHPIPQEVTGFQFKLIGDMTIKQFAYLATGIVIGWILFALPINIFIKFPLVAFFVVLGLGLAFVPIQGRPMDLMVVSFIKALFRPTVFIYKNSNTNPPLPIQTKENKGETQKEGLKDASQKPEVVTEKVLPKIQENQSLSLDAQQKVLELEKTLRETNAQKEELARQVSTLLQKAEQKQSEQTTNVRRVPKTIAKGIGLPIAPEAPNLIMGVVKDPRGNPLPNVLVEVKDSDGNPVRAFKTNPLGQFASATPLVNGIYTIELEDPKTQNRFDTIEVNVDGKIIAPFSIDPREELRRSLFKQGG